MNLSTRRLLQRCLFMHSFINDSERNRMITRGTDYHSHNTRSKETIRSFRSNTNWGLLRSFKKVHCKTGIPFQKTRDVYLIMPLKFHCLNILNLIDSLGVASHAHLFYHIFCLKFQVLDFLIPIVSILLIIT